MNFNNINNKYLKIKKDTICNYIDIFNIKNLIK